jgi:hypothetical protein
MIETARTSETSVNFYQTTRNYTHRPDDWGSKDLWNVGKLLPNYTTLQLRRQPSSQMNPVHILISYFFDVHYTVSLSTKRTSSFCLLLPALYIRVLVPTYVTFICDAASSRDLALDTVDINLVHVSSFWGAVATCLCGLSSWNTHYNPPPPICTLKHGELIYYPFKVEST